MAVTKISSELSLLQLETLTFQPDLMAVGVAVVAILVEAAKNVQVTKCLVSLILAIKRFTTQYCIEIYA